MKVESAYYDEGDQDNNVDMMNCSKISKSRKPRNMNDCGGSSSFKGLTFGKLGGRSSGRIAAEWVDKLE